MRRKAWNGAPAPRDEAEARARLLDATERSVRRVGRYGISLAAVAAEAGVSRRTVYRYFSDADELLAAAELRAGGGLLDRIRRVAESSLPPRERVLEGLVMFVEHAPLDPLLSRYLDAREFDAASVINDDTIRRTLVQFAALYYEAPLSDRAAEELKDLGEVILRTITSLCAVPPKPGRSRRILELALHRVLDEVPQTMPT